MIARRRFFARASAASISPVDAEPTYDFQKTK
jgi:hypothetical protein